MGPLKALHMTVQPDLTIVIWKLMVVRLKSFFFLNIAKTNYPGEMKLNLNKEKLY